MNSDASLPILTLAIEHEHDVVAARQRAHRIAQLLGFDGQDQTRIATAVSEIARNAFTYAHGGQVEFVLEGQVAPQVLLTRIRDRGTGILDLDAVLSGQYRSETGMGLGILGARRLMDQFDIESKRGQGTTVWMRKVLPRRARLWRAADLVGPADNLAAQPQESPFHELHRQNQELLRALAELRQRQDELEQLNQELEDTNRGVVALYAELDEKADHLRKADELKTRFLSNMSHEFKTPLNSMLALTGILLDRTDGDLTTEQAKQMGFVKTAAEDLLELVNDLLDIAKVEAGKIVIHPSEFQVVNLFGALRGMLRPLLLNQAVNLVFEDVHDLPTLYTDEGKVSQILRNLISNALKFTERGEVRIAAQLGPANNEIVFTVSDTGIGIAPEYQEIIFQEFTQVPSHLQKSVHGTGLGLPLSRRLAELLGGKLTLASQVGVGSTFTVTIPMVYAEARPAAPVREPGETPELQGALPVLAVEDDPQQHLIYDNYLRGTGWSLKSTRSLQEAQRVLARIHPAAILLDILFPGQDAWKYLGQLKSSPATRDIPVIVISTVDDAHKGMALGADAYGVKPITREWLVQQLRTVTRMRPLRRVLVVDDDEVFRYLLRRDLTGGAYRLIEAASGAEGLVRAREELPEAIILDLVMPGMNGDEMLETLATDPNLRQIPVILLTSKTLTPDEQARIEKRTFAILHKRTGGNAAVRDIIERALAYYETLFPSGLS